MLGSDGTPPQRQLRPRRIQSRSPTSASRMPCTRCRTTRCRAQSSPKGAHRNPLRSGPHQKHVKTVTMRADSLANTEGYFFKTLLERQEGTQKHLNELAAQLTRQKLYTTKNAQHRKTGRRKQAGARPLEHMLPACQVSSSSARREWESGGPAPLTSSFLRVPSQAAHPTRRRPDGTKRSRHVTASQSTHHSEWSSTSETKPRPRRSGRSGVDLISKEKFTAALIPIVEARDVTVSPRTPETLAMPKAELLAASTSASAGE